MAHKFLIFAAFAAMLVACSREPDIDVAARVDAIASEFVIAYYDQYPEEVYEVGYPDSPMNRFGNHDRDARNAWSSNVDALLAGLVALDATKLAGTPAAVTYDFVRERLQSIVDRRVCRMDLWNVSPTWTGWQYSIISTLGVQPVGTPGERADALARAKDIARFLDTEIANLRQGLDEGYVAPSNNVTRVIDQVTALIDTPTADSPFADPAGRSDDAAFVDAYHAVVANEIRPAMIRYRDFLANDYDARDEIGVSALTDGNDCYRASVRYWSSLNMDPMDIHRTGLSEMSRIRTEMLEIAREHFGTDDLSALFDELRSNPHYTFNDENHMLDYLQDAVDRAERVMPEWFGNVPDAEVVIVPSPAYEQDSGGGFYSAGSVDGSRPGTYKAGTWNPTAISMADQEAIAFHETWPGHHLQVSLALLNDDLHAALRYMFISGFVEGWALYTERLADEIGLYSSPMARLGMLSNEAYRAARLVVDPGIHVLGWTRQQAIDYMLENTASSAEGIASEIDRYSAVPGQATSYLLGSLEIQRLRRHAETLLGERFDIREFHDRLLENGGVTLPMLGAAVDAWVTETLADAEAGSP